VVKVVGDASPNVIVHSIASCALTIRYDVDALEQMTPDLISNGTRAKF
jgi:hypothetical protein